MSDDAVTVVRGRGIARATPDTVEIRLGVSWLEQSPESAMAEATRRALVLERILNDAGIEANARRTSGITVRPEREWNGKVYVHRGYIAAQEVVVRLAGAGKLGGLISRATEEAQATIHGPTWIVAHDNPARIEACTLAARDARRKADAYAAALGAGLGAVASIMEPDVEWTRAGVAGIRAMSVADADDEMPISSGDLDVSAMVEVCFHIEQ